MLLLPVPLLCLGLALLLSGCGSIAYERASFDGAEVANPTFGEGIRYPLPLGYERLQPEKVTATPSQGLTAEAFLRNLAYQKDLPSEGMGAFRECLLFRSGERYLLVHHIGLNLSQNLRTMHPAARNLILPDLASRVSLDYGITGKNFDYRYETVAGRKVIAHPPFPKKRPDGGDSGWRGTGYSLLGETNEVVVLFGFARETDLATLQADLRFVLESLQLGAARPTE